MAKLKKKYVEVSYPSRLNVMAIDPSKIATNKNLVYTPGEIIIKVKIHKLIKIRVREDSEEIFVSPASKRPTLIRHSALLMKTALGFSQGLEIDVENVNELRHVGLGSSSGLIAGVASAINEVFGKPVSPANLVQYLAQNHGEEIDGSKEFINPVQCIGGSAAAGMFRGALLVLSGKSRVIQSMEISNDFEIIIGIPKDYVELDSKILLKKELKVMHKFVTCGKKYGPIIAYRVLHSVLPAMVERDLKTIGDLVFDYRFKMGSIVNCSYTYPKLISLTDRLSFLKTEGIVDLLSISSVGPAVFAVTKDIDSCRKAFEKENLKVYITRPENDKYQLLKSS